jgi:murein L,D-transpeptidase YafK
MRRNITTFVLSVFSPFILTGLSSQTQAKTLPSACQNTLAFSKQKYFGIAKAPVSDYLLVDKSRRLLHLFQDGQIIKSYQVGLGNNPVGAKQAAGDGKTPEGSYFIDSRNAASNFHLALHISYPDQDDINNARKKGLEPGGAIMIHGLPNEGWKKIFIRQPSDWTKGCVAVKDREIEEIWDMVKPGTPIDLCP